MKGIIIATEQNGNITRLSKEMGLCNYLWPILNKPLIYYTIEMLIKAGITDIYIMIDRHTVDVSYALDKSNFENKFHYILRTSAFGTAYSLYQCKHFVKDDSVAIVFASECFDIDLAKEVQEFKMGAKVFLEKVDPLVKCMRPVFLHDLPYTLGRTAMDKSSILEIKEATTSFYHYAIPGLILCDNSIFSSINISSSAEETKVISDCLNKYIEKFQLDWESYPGAFWSRIDSSDSLNACSEYWQHKK